MRRSYLFPLLATVLVVAAPRPAAAQVTLNPRTVEWVPSADHNALDPLTGAPILLSYQLDCGGTGGTPVSKDMGKPAPAANLIGPIVVPEFATLTKGVAFTCTITPVGPSGPGLPTLPSLPLGIAGPVRVPAAPPTRPVVKP